MLNLYEEYESQFDREEAVLLEHAEIKMDKAVLAVQTNQAMNDIAMREAECRLVLESGDVMNLVDYYEDATEDGKEKEKGLLAKAWDAIMGLLKKIKETLFGAEKPKADPNEEIEVDEGFLDRHKKLGKAVAAIKNFFTNPFKAVVALIAAGGAVALFIGVTKSGKFRKVKGSQMNASIDASEKALDEVEGGLKGFLSKFGKKKATDKDGEAQGKIGGFLKSIRSHIEEGYASIKNKRMSRKGDKAAKKNGEKTENVGGTEIAVKNMTGNDYAKQVDSLKSQLKDLQIKKSNSHSATESDSLAEKIKELQKKISQAESARDMANSTGTNQMGESAEDDYFGFDFNEDGDDIYGEDAGDLSDIADLLAVF